MLVDLSMASTIIASTVYYLLFCSVNGATVTTGAGSHDTVATSDDLVDKILENTQPDLLEFLTDLLPHSDSDND